MWDILFERQVAALGDRIVRPFRDGLELLHLSHPGIPELAELNVKLEGANRMGDGGGARDWCPT